MVKAGSSRTVARVSQESVWGVTDAVAMRNISMLNDTLNIPTATAMSATIRGDTNQVGIARVAQSAEGGINFDMQYGANDHHFFEGALRSTWSTDVGITASTTIAAVASGNELTSSAEFGNVQVGQFMPISGFVTPGNNGLAKVTAVNSTSSINITGLTLTVESAGPAVTMKGSFMKNGTTDKSWSIEKEFTDITEFTSFLGMRVGTLSLTITPGAVVTGSVGFLGKSGASSVTTIGTGTPVASSSNQFMNSTDNVTDIRLDDVATTNEFSELTINIDTGLRSQPAIGFLNPVGVASGTLKVTGSMKTYFENALLYKDYLDFIKKGLSFAIKDTAGNTYVIDLRQFNLTGDAPQIGGIDQDVTLNSPFECFIDDSFGGTIGVTKIDA